MRFLIFVPILIWIVSVSLDVANEPYMNTVAVLIGGPAAFVLFLIVKSVIDEELFRQDMKRMNEESKNYDGEI